jgi:nicotinamidase-related amidase
MTTTAKRPWDDLITDEDRAAYAAAGFGGPSGIGQRPALLVIDMQYRTTGTRRAPLAEAQKEFATACGERAWDAAERIGPLLALFREKHWPVLYPHVAPKQAWDAGRLAAKVPTMMGIAARGYDFFPAIAPRDGDILLPKKHPSAFFGTALASHLVDLRADTLVMVGCATSGCIRASVVDAFSYNFRVVVPHDCVYDRGTVAHAVNLFDMSEKYADVMSAHEAIEQLNRLPAGSHTSEGSQP